MTSKCPKENEPFGHSTVAVVGLSCRFPEANNPDAFWKLLCEGVCTITEVPVERFDITPFYDPNLGKGSTNSRWGAFLDDVAHFDPLFFGISPLEASAVDPQQRLLLELAWEAFEDAGIIPGTLRDSDTGVFVGSCFADYADLQCGDLGMISPYTLAGTNAGVQSGRISYTWGLVGPSITINTASSSALVAVHRAWLSVAHGECSLALAGGVNLMLEPSKTIALAQLGSMSSDGTVKPFDAAANGYVRGEGAGIVLLKPYAQALADGNPVHCIILGGAVNHDGASNGLPAPRMEAQQWVLERAYAGAGIDPAMVTYIETHGTGTPVGDPMETQALGMVLGGSHSEGRQLLIGSCKPNIGHLEGAAGIAGLLKLILAIKNRIIPPTINHENPNPAIPFKKLNIAVNTELKPWPEGRPIIGGVNSFGLGGTNAHLIVQGVDPQPRRPAESEESARLLCISANTIEELRELAKDISPHITSQQQIVDLGYTYALHRTQYPMRLALSGAGIEEFQSALSDFCSGVEAPNIICNATKVEPQKVAFVFPGQGSQWLGMGREMLKTEPLFLRKMEACEAAFAPFVAWSLISQLQASEETSRLAEDDVAQPMIFALQVSIAALWHHWGVTPDAVIGHSMGEVAAAHVAGCLNLEDAARIICRRSQLVKRIKGKGGMALLETSAQAAQKRLAGHNNQVVIAAVNSPTTVLLAGETEALDKLVAQYQAEDVFCRRVATNYASHSHFMDELLEELQQTLTPLRPGKGDVPLYSTAKNEISPLLDAGYWADNLRQPVEFHCGISRLLDNGFNTFIEISPHPVLTHTLKKCLANHPDHLILPSLKQGEFEKAAMLLTYGTLYTVGFRPNWQAFYAETGNLVKTPGYPWQRERYWLDIVAPVIKPIYQDHPLAGNHIDLPLEEILFESKINTQDLPYLEDHRIFEMRVMPGVAYLEIALNGARKIFGNNRLELAQFRIPKICPLLDHSGIHLQSLFKAEGEHLTFKNFARPLKGEGVGWTLHANGRVRLCESSDQNLQMPNMILARCREKIPIEAFHKEMERLGWHHESFFKGIKELYRGEGESLALVIGSPESARQVDRYMLYPPLLDAAMRTGLYMVGHQEEKSGYVLHSVGELRHFHPLPIRFWAHTTFETNKGNGDSLAFDLVLLDDDGRILTDIKDVQLKKAERGVIYHAMQNRLDKMLFQIKWKPQPYVAGDRPRYSAGNWLVLADNSGVGSEICSFIESKFGKVFLVHEGRAFEKTGPRTFTVNPYESEHFKQILEEVYEQTDGPLLGAIHLWSLDRTLVEEVDKTWEQSESLGAGALHLVQALGDRKLIDRFHLWWVTRGSRAIGRKQVSPVQAILWGFGRVVEMEHGRLNSVLLDLDPETPETGAETLCNELLADDLEDQIAYQGGIRYVARLNRFESLEDQGVESQRRRDQQLYFHPMALDKAKVNRSSTDRNTSINSLYQFDPEGTYLIVGGSSGIGLECALWMAEEGARHLVLIAHHGMSPQIHEDIEKMRQAGADVSLMEADITNETVMQKIFGTIARQHPVRGIIHAAVVIRNEFLSREDLKHLQLVMGPQIKGALIVHKITHKMELDFFMLFSNAASLLGTPGHGLHAATGAFLNSLAHYRRAQGLTSLAIDWGPWETKDEGFLTYNTEFFREQSLGVIEMEEGAALIQKLLVERATYAGAFAFDAIDFSHNFIGDHKPSFVEDLLREYRQRSFYEELEETKEQTQPWIGPFEVQNADNARDQVFTHIREMVLQAIGIPLSRSIDPNKPFRQLGLDSMLSVKLHNQLQDHFGRPLPATIAFDYPNLNLLTDFLIAELFTAPTETPEHKSAPALRETQATCTAEEHGSLGDLQEMSEDELTELLNMELNSLG